MKVSSATDWLIEAFEDSHCASSTPKIAYLKMARMNTYVIFVPFPYCRDKSQQQLPAIKQSGLLTEISRRDLTARRPARDGSCHCRAILSHGISKQAGELSRPKKLREILYLLTKFFVTKNFVNRDAAAAAPLAAFHRPAAITSRADFSLLRIYDSRTKL